MAETSRERPSTWPRPFEGVRSVLSFAVLAAGFGVATPAHPQSGTVNIGGASPYGAVCAGDVDVIYPCGTDSEHCELTPNGGVPVGFCENGAFAAGVREVVSGPLEFDVVVKGTSYGTVTILSQPPDPDSIIVCRAIDDKKSCRQVFDEPGPAQNCGACDGSITTHSSSCAGEAAALAASIAPGLQADELAFFLGVNYEALDPPGQAGSIQLTICPSHRCACFDPGGTQPSGVIEAKQVPYYDWQTPGCAKPGGSRYCQPLK